MSEPLLAWHLGPGNPETGEVRSTYRRNLVIRLGDTVTAREGIVPCKRGPHASVRAVDALRYGYYPVISRVELSGEIIPHGDPVDKHVATHRRHVAMADCHRVTPLWAAVVVTRPALQAITWRTVAQAEWDAIDLVERWAADPDAVSGSDLDAAAWAARDARAAWAARDARAAWAARAARDARAAWAAWDARAAWAAWDARAAWAAWDARDARAAWAARDARAAELDRAFRWLCCEIDERPAWIPASIAPGMSVLRGGNG